MIGTKRIRQLVDNLCGFLSVLAAFEGLFLSILIGPSVRDIFIWMDNKIVEYRHCFGLNEMMKWKYIMGCIRVLFEGL